MGFFIALLHHGITFPHGADTLVKGGWICKCHEYPVEMAQNFWLASFAFIVCFVVTVALSLATRRTKSDEELTGLVYSLTPRQSVEQAWYARPGTIGIALLAVCVLLNYLFW